MSKSKNELKSGLPVYLTYGQLNGHSRNQLGTYKYKVKAYNDGVYKVIEYANERLKTHQKLTNKSKRLATFRVSCRTLVVKKTDKTDFGLDLAHDSHSPGLNKLKTAKLMLSCDLFWLILGIMPHRCPDFELVLQEGGVIQVKRGLQTTKWRGGKSVQCQPVVSGMQLFRLQVTKTDDFTLDFFDDLQLFDFSTRAQVG